MKLDGSVATRAFIGQQTDQACKCLSGQIVFRHIKKQRSWGARRVPAGAGASALALKIILNAHFFNKPQLRLQPVDMLFL